jgi:hypothetical protein
MQTFNPGGDQNPQPTRVALQRRAAASFNKPDAVNPAMALQFAGEDQGRRVTDLERSEKGPLAKAKATG